MRSARRNSRSLICNAAHAVKKTLFALHYDSHLRNRSRSLLPVRISREPRDTFASRRLKEVFCPPRYSGDAPHSKSRTLAIETFNAFRR